MRIHVAPAAFEMCTKLNCLDGSSVFVLLVGNVEIVCVDGDCVDVVELKWDEFMDV